MAAGKHSLVPRPSPAPVFDRIYPIMWAGHKAIKNWSRGRPGNEAKQASKQPSKHTHARAQCSPASVGLAQARPNQLVRFPTTVPCHNTRTLWGSLSKLIQAVSWQTEMGARRRLLCPLCSLSPGTGVPGEGLFGYMLSVSWRGSRGRNVTGVHMHRLSFTLKS